MNHACCTSVLPASLHHAHPTDRYAPPGAPTDHGPDVPGEQCGHDEGRYALWGGGLHTGRNIAQIGLLPFANTKKAHDKAKAAGITVATAAVCKAEGLAGIATQALALLASRCDVIHVDFDIDVVERSAMPGAPGARPGGVAVQDFFNATRVICAHPKVRSIDLTEFDPSLDVAAISALTAARWVCEALAGFQKR